jgi:glycosyltransferase involved in cell wall biosynthesis
MPVRDGAQGISRALEALDSAKKHIGEVIVVDDGSTDGSGDVASAFGVRVERLAAHSGAPSARNHGARCARGDVLFFWMLTSSLPNPRSHDWVL